MQFYFTSHKEEVCVTRNCELKVSSINPRERVNSSLVGVEQTRPRNVAARTTRFYFLGKKKSFFVTTLFHSRDVNVKLDNVKAIHKATFDLIAHFLQLPMFMLITIGCLFKCVHVGTKISPFTILLCTDSWFRNVYAYTRWCTMPICPYDSDMHKPLGMSPSDTDSTHSYHTHRPRKVKKKDS